MQGYLIVTNQLHQFCRWLEDRSQSQSQTATGRRNTFEKEKTSVSTLSIL